MPRSLWTPFCPEGSLPFSLSLSLVHPFIQLCSVFRPLPLWFCKQVNRNLFLTQLSPQPCAPLATSPHLCQGSFALSLQLSFLYPHWWRPAPQPVSWLLPFPDSIVPLFWTSRPFGGFFVFFFCLVKQQSTNMCDFNTGLSLAWIPLWDTGPRAVLQHPWPGAGVLLLHLLQHTRPGCPAPLALCSKATLLCSSPFFSLSCLP